MELAMRSEAGDPSRLDVSDRVFGAEYKPGLVHQVVTAYLAAARAGTRAQKNRAAVRGGGAKPWRQKGTGRARAGTSRSPLWRGGGVTFAASPADYSQKVNRKMYRGAVRAILSELVRQERLHIVPSFGVAAPKTKELVTLLAGHGVANVLIVTEELDDNLVLASRNLKDVEVLAAREVDPVSLMAFDALLVTEAAVRRLEERLS
ncbi:50S ribosomal protein L4 [Thioalkalicoccus limnaeus]|uniref:Large ribosomal subunit protein uL4 n=1 Tax=Thioalkalicoccus limnaeus TaxID=120681 RepID=A0ABV4B9D6_9GAMM